jgi:PIN domain nuclease of toxin-antitoxin system
LRLLLDTNAFLWFAIGSSRLSSAARTAIEDSDGGIFVSTVTPWELAIKAGAGKLELREPVSEIIRKGMLELNAVELPIRHVHALAVTRLPAHHSDPFDRMLVAQSRVEGVALITSDPRIQRYGVEIIW